MANINCLPYDTRPYNIITDKVLENIIIKINENFIKKRRNLIYINKENLKKI